MRGITRAIVAVMLVVGAVPAVGAAQHIDYTDADAGPSDFVSNAGSADVHVNSQGDDPDGEGGSADGGSNESEATGPAAGDDVDGDGYGDGAGQLVDDPYDYFESLQCLEKLPYDYYEAELIPCEDDSELVLMVGGGGGGLTAIHLDLAVTGDGDGDGEGAAGDGSTGRASGDGNDAPAAVSDDDWWDRVRCLRPLPVDPAPPIEPIPCEDDGELVLMRANGDDGGVSQGFPVQGGVVRVHRFDAQVGDGVDRPVQKKSGRTTDDDLTLERGYVLRADDGSNDGVESALERTDSWVVVPASASGSKAELIESIAKFEAGDGETRNVLGGIVRTDADGSRETILVVKELDKASPKLFEALASDHGDGDRTVVIEVTEEIDKASPKLYEARDPDDDGDGVPTAQDDESVGFGDADGPTEHTSAGGTPAAVVDPDGTPCPIQWPTGPFDPTGPTSMPCPVFAAFATDTGGVAGAVSPSDSHDIAGAVTPSDAHDIAGAVTPSDAHAAVGAVSPSSIAEARAVIHE